MEHIKRLLLCRRNGGFTLAEVIISCALLGILIMGMFMFVAPILDTVNSTNESTRASNAAESVEYYISRSIRNAAYIAVLTDTNFTDVQSKASDIIMALKGKGGEANYNLKCISIRYMADEKSGNNKYFICNESFSPAGTLDSALTEKVFDSCYFEGVYPKVALTQVQQEQDDGSKKNMPAVQINVEVYDDPQLRKDGGNGYSGLVFSGTGYTILRNIELSQQDKTLNQPFNIVNSGTIGKELGTLPVSLSSGDPDDESKEMETYIFYVERTLAVTTPTT